MTTFARELNELPISVPRAGLLFAREIAYPELDVQHYMQMLDGLAQEARAQVAQAESPAEALADFLFYEQEFRGNEEAYSDPRNSEIAMENAPDRYRFILEQPIREAPGETWIYSGGAVALLGS